MRNLHKLIAGTMRGEAWSMLTTDPGPKVAPFHSRQVVVMAPAAAAAWLKGAPEVKSWFRAWPGP